MQIDFSNNYFELFGFDVDFCLDKAVLNDRWQSLQRTVHPDNFVNGSDTERRFSMQSASLINEAHKVLSEPLARAGYLLQLKGIDLDVETDTRMSGEFLMEQMELREKIDEVKTASDPYAEIDGMRQGLKQKESQLAESFAREFASSELQLAREKVREWQFIDKLRRELSDIEAALDDA